MIQQNTKYRTKSTALPVQIKGSLHGIVGPEVTLMRFVTFKNKSNLMTAPRSLAHHAAYFKCICTVAMFGSMDKGNQFNQPVVRIIL